MLAVKKAENNLRGRSKFARWLSSKIQNDRSLPFSPADNLSLFIRKFYCSANMNKVPRTTHKHFRGSLVPSDAQLCEADIFLISSFWFHASFKIFV